MSRSSPSAPSGSSSALLSGVSPVAASNQRLPLRRAAGQHWRRPPAALSGMICGVIVHWPQTAFEEVSPDHSRFVPRVLTIEQEPPSRTIAFALVMDPRTCPTVPPRTSRLGRDFHVIDGRVRFRNRLAHFTHSLEVRNQGTLKVPTRLFLRVAHGHAPGNIRRIGGVARPCLFDDHRISSRAHFSPAFLSITFNVPGASSMPLLPGTVTT